MLGANGETRNGRITLGALIIALGLLVDDAIIAIEMIVVKMEQGWDRPAQVDTMKARYFHSPPACTKGGAETFTLGIVRRY